MRNQEEYELQVKCFQWICRNPLLFPFFYSIDHGEVRNIAVAMKLKAKGVKGGISDCLFLQPNNENPCIWLELKVKKRKLSDKQQVFFDQAKKCGMKCVVCRTLESFINEMKEYIK